MKNLRPCLIAVLFSAFAHGVEPGFKMDNVVLYQPDEVLSPRLPDVSAFSDYVKRLQKVCVEYFEKEEKPETLHVVIAVKPGKKSRVWFVSAKRPNMKALVPLREKLEKVPAAEVFGGSVVFAVSGSIAGGDGKAKVVAGEFRPPIPKEWEEAVKGRKETVEVPDGFLARVWPDAPGDAPKEIPAPPGFENQVLEPTGGRILRPKGWHYAEKHSGKHYMWTISKEDSAKGYTTGVRIQAFTGVKEGAGKSAKEFIEDFIDQKKKSADRVIKSCEPKEMGLFVRVCLEVEEGKDHILYSLFWGANDLDMAVVAISGTTKELWKEFSGTFDRMGAFELIDMKRFDKDGKK